VLIADNGKIGQELALKNSPDLIISDLMMPVMDGIEMCKRIKTDINTSHIPVIILTANMWGIYRKEWKGVATKTKRTITAGIVVILLAVVLVGIGNSM